MVRGAGYDHHPLPSTGVHETDRGVACPSYVLQSHGPRIRSGCPRALVRRVQAAHGRPHRCHDLRRAPCPDHDRRRRRGGRLRGLTRATDAQLPNSSATQERPEVAELFKGSTPSARLCYSTSGAARPPGEGGPCRRRGSRTSAPGNARGGHVRPSSHSVAEHPLTAVDARSPRVVDRASAITSFGRGDRNRPVASWWTRERRVPPLDSSRCGRHPWGSRTHCPRPPVLPGGRGAGRHRS